MLMVTPDAAAFLHQIMTEAETEPGQVLRLHHQRGKLSLVLDTQQDGDQVVLDGSASVLLIDEDLSSGLEGYMLELEDGTEGKQLLFKRKDTEG